MYMRSHLALAAYLSGCICILISRAANKTLRHLNLQATSSRGGGCLEHGESSGRGWKLGSKPGAGQELARKQGVR